MDVGVNKAWHHDTIAKVLDLVEGPERDLRADLGDDTVLDDQRRSLDRGKRNSLEQQSSTN